MKGGGKKTDATCMTIIRRSACTAGIFSEKPFPVKKSDTGIMAALIGPQSTGGTSCPFVLVSL